MMIFSSIKGAAIECVAGKKKIVFFPQDKAPSADLVFLSAPQEVPEEGKISWPGEYDIEGIAIHGIAHNDGAQVSYVIEYEGTRSAFLSSPLHDWTDLELEKLGNIDVLVVPSDDAKIVQKLVDEVDPRVLFPIETDAKEYQEVLKIVGAKDAEAVDEYKVKGLPSEGREVVLLKTK